MHSLLSSGEIVNVLIPKSNSSFIVYLLKILIAKIEQLLEIYVYTHKDDLTKLKTLVDEFEILERTNPLILY